MHNNIVVPEYGMFTEQAWHQVSGLLQQLSSDPAYEEAMDTVVRERVWEELKYE